MAWRYAQTRAFLAIDCNVADTASRWRVAVDRSGLAALLQTYMDGCFGYAMFSIWSLSYVACLRMFFCQVLTCRLDVVRLFAC